MARDGARAAGQGGAGRRHHRVAEPRRAGIVGYFGADRRGHDPALATGAIERDRWGVGAVARAQSSKFAVTAKNPARSRADTPAITSFSMACSAPLTARAVARPLLVSRIRKERRSA